MGTITFKGVSSATHDVYIENIPPLPMWERRISTVEVPGRDGDLLLTNDDYAPATVGIDMAVKTDAKLYDIAAWLTGSGDLILSSRPTKRLKARVSGQTNIEALRRYRKFPVLFTVQPFWYEATPAITTLVASGSVTNPGSRWSLPIIEVTGTGTLTIGSYVLVVTESGVTINSEIEECYAGAIGKNSKVSGTYPRLGLGATTITLGAGITQVKITGNWRWY